MINTNKDSHTEETKEKLLLAAFELFTKNGFDGTSTREICKQAGVNISLIPYYFGSKEGLYHAAIKKFAEFALVQMTPALGKIDNIQNNTKKENILLLHNLIEHFAQFALNPNMPKSAFAFVIREQLEASPAFEIVYETTMRHIYGAFKKLVAAIIDKDESEPEVTYRTTSIAGQVMAFRMAKLATLRSLGREEYTEKDIKAIKKIVKSNVDAILKSAGEVS